MKTMVNGKLMQFLKNRYVISGTNSAAESAESVGSKEAAVEAPEAIVETAIAAEVNVEPNLEPEPKVIAKQAEPCDTCGYSYGWWVMLGDNRVASLEFRCVLEDSVHLYAVIVLDKKFFDINLDPAKWAKPEVILQSRYSKDYKKAGLEMAPVGKDMIVVQNLVVPKENLKRQADRITAFHDELLQKASKTEVVHN